MHLKCFIGPIGKCVRHDTYIHALADNTILNKRVLQNSKDSRCSSPPIRNNQHVSTPPLSHFL